MRLAQAKTESEVAQSTGEWAQAVIELGRVDFESVELPQAWTTAGLRDRLAGKIMGRAGLE
eukprot:2388154-Lingulodinium_polyedra.AAC.1